MTRSDYRTGVSLLLAATLCAAVVTPAGAQRINGDQAKTASSGPSRVIGIYANGCIAGARRLPPNGSGYVVLRPQRNRHWGHPRLLRFVRAFGAWVRERYGRVALVADLSAPRGGPITGHASHEVGLDGDIRFLLLRPKGVSNRYLLDPPYISMLNADKTAIDRKRWTRRQVAMVRFAASYPSVDRIFVHPVIKRELCRAVGGGPQRRAWLRKVVDWYGHHAHMHVRMKCPADSPQCIKQIPLPKGTGCGWRNARWFRKILPAYRRWLRSGKKARPKPPPELPTACLILFNR